MNMDIEKLQKEICSILCADVQLLQRNGSIVMLQTPFSFADGDPYQIYLRELPSGQLRMSDKGHTLMHLSYENDIDKFREGTRGKIFDGILSELDLAESDGEFYLDFNPDKIGYALFRFGQAITKINDLTFLNRIRVESTFYEDLYESITRTISEDKITKDYVYPHMDKGEDYPIDYRIEGKDAPLFLFGVPGRDKARLTTIVLERLLRENAQFESLIVFANQADMPRADLARLTNVGGEMVSSLDAQQDLDRKLLRRVAH